jgi:hypothetical protein
MGKNDDGLVHGLSYQKESDERLFGVPRIITARSREQRA